MVVVVDPAAAKSTPLVLASARPCTVRLPRGATALLMIDLQRDFLDPGGFGAALGNDVQACRSILPACAAVLASARAAGLPVVHTLESHKPDLSDCPPSKGSGPRAPTAGRRIGDVIDPAMGRVLVRGEPGNATVEEVAPLPSERVVHKPGKGAFFGTGLHAWLQSRGITHLVFTGVTTEVCVQTTMREANDRGFECVLLEDCTASYFPELKAATIAMVEAQGGIVGYVAQSGELIDELPRTRHPVRHLKPSPEPEVKTPMEDPWKTVLENYTSEELTHETLLQGNMYLPLCCKPVTLKMISSKPYLLERAIRQRLTRGGGSNGKLLLFIADGDVMAKASIAMDPRVTKAYRQVAEISAQIAAFIDPIINKLQDEDEEFRERITGWINWSDVAAGPMFQNILCELQQIMQFSSNEATLSHNDDLDNNKDLHIGIQAIQTAVKTLIKNLYTQRARKGSVTNIFPGKGLDILEGKKWQDRYDHLEESCLLELSSILGGIEHQGRVYTEMWYMTPDATGMTFIAKCVETIRGALINMPDNQLTPKLKIVATQTHNLELLNYEEKCESGHSLDMLPT